MDLESGGTVLSQGSYRQGRVKFKDFSRTNLTIFKDLGWML